MGSFGDFRTGLFASGTVGQFDIASAIRFSQADDYNDGKGDKFEASALHGNFGYFLKMGWSFDPLNRLGISFNGSRLYEAQSGAGTMATGSTVPAPFKGLDYTDAQWKQLDMVDLVYEGGTESKDFNWLLRYFIGQSSYTSKRTFLVTPAVGYPTRYLTSDSSTDHNGAQAQISWNHDIVHLTAGIDWIKYEMTQIQRQPPYTTGAAASRNSDGFSTTSNTGAFLLGRLNLLENQNLVFSAGIRYDTFDVTTDSLINYVSQPSLKHKYEKTLPSFGIAYSPIDEIKLRASYGVAYRVPTPREYMGNFYMSSTLYLGDIDLKPEESSTFDFGFDAQWQNLYGSATYFSTNFKNYIGTEGTATASAAPDCPVTSCNRYININNVTFRGIEASLKFNVGRQLGYDFDLSPYMYYSHLFKYATKDTNLKLAGIADTTFSGGIDFNYEPQGIAFNVKGTYWKPSTIVSFGNQTQHPRGGGVTVWDLTLTKNLVDFSNHGSLKLRVEIENLTDQLYETTTSAMASSIVYMPGRALYVGLIYDLN
jgi:outer membrane receptor protein involved in Fe transport